MKENPPLLDQIIIDCLHNNYGIQVTTLTFLPIGADIHAYVYKVRSTGQIVYFVKLKRGYHHDIGVAIVDLLRKAGVQQVIPPIQTIHGRLTQRVEDFTLIVYPFIEGRNGFSRDLTDHQWFELGQALRQVHDIDVPSSIKGQMRQEVYSAKWREIVRALYVCMDAKPIDEIALKLLKFMKKNIHSIRRLVDRAESLSQKLLGQSSKFVLCHSDIHAGNVLLGDNKKVYIVDWDDPSWRRKNEISCLLAAGLEMFGISRTRKTFFTRVMERLK